MTVSLCIRQESKRNDDSVSVEELDWSAERQLNTSGVTLNEPQTHHQTQMTCISHQNQKILFRFQLLIKNYDIFTTIMLFSPNRNAKNNDDTICSTFKVFMHQIFKKYIHHINIICI